MRTEHLKYFLNLVETGSITQTSKELYTTHQNVSKIIRQLEEDLGTTLFIRTAKGIELTATGKLLFPLAQRTFADFAQLRSNITALEVRSDIAGNLQILSSDLVSFSVLSSLIQIFADLYPSLQIHLENAEVTHILQQIALHPQMIGVVVVLNNPLFAELYQPYMEHIHLTPLLEDTYYCAVNQDMPLANLKSITLNDFAQQSIATPTMNKNNESILSRLISSHGGKISFSSNSLHAYSQALLSGRCVGISSNLAHKRNLEDNALFTQIKLIPFQEDMRFSISLAVHIHPQLNEAGKAFVDFMKNNKIYL